MTGPVLTLEDGTGHRLDLAERPTRVISLVPSLTEALAATVPEVLVGATDWCTHPSDLDVDRVRGTKNPDHRAIARLRPGLVVANREENRRIDVERMREAGLPVWVTVVESVDQALVSLRRLLVEVLGADEPGLAGHRHRGVAPSGHRASGPGGGPHLAGPLDGGGGPHLQWRPAPATGPHRAVR